MGVIHYPQNIRDVWEWRIELVENFLSLLNYSPSGLLRPLQQRRVTVVLGGMDVALAIHADRNG